VADGQGALIQGMRRIADLAQMGVLGALLGTIVSIATIYVLREDGVVPSLVAVAAMSALVSCWYSRKVPIERPAMTIRDVRQEAGALLKLGVVFMASGFLMLGVAYAVRMIVLRNGGLEATGLYECAWTLGGLYVGFILQAMGTDFYPRLVSVANNNEECNRLVNEQTQVSLLLAAPGVIATLTFAPLVIAMFYSDRFAGAVDVLRWICLGMALRVVTWPMGYIIVAKGRRVVFLASELAWTVVALASAWLCVSMFGLTGAGMAFAAAYVFHGVMIYSIVRRLSGFRWWATNARTGLEYLTFVVVVFCGFHELPVFWGSGIGVLMALISGILSVHRLRTIAAPGRTSGSVERLLTLFRSAS
jgi:PST family polysaccharide transporter